MKKSLHLLVILLSNSWLSKWHLYQGWSKSIIGHVFYTKSKTTELCDGLESHPFLSHTHYSWGRLQIYPDQDKTHHIHHFSMSFKGILALLDETGDEGYFSPHPKITEEKMM